MRTREVMGLGHCAARESVIANFLTTSFLDQVGVRAVDLLSLPLTDLRACYSLVDRLVAEPALRWLCYYRAKAHWEQIEVLVRYLVVQPAKSAIWNIGGQAREWTSALHMWSGLFT